MMKAHIVLHTVRLTVQPNWQWCYIKMIHTGMDVFSDLTEIKWVCLNLLWKKVGLKWIMPIKISLISMMLMLFVNHIELLSRHTISVIRMIIIWKMENQCLSMAANCEPIWQAIVREVAFMYLKQNLTQCRLRICICNVDILIMARIYSMKTSTCSVLMLLTETRRLSKIIFRIPYRIK